MSSSITDIREKSSQIMEAAELIIKKLSTTREDSSLTINKLKNSVKPNYPWSIFLSGLAYLSEKEIIRILDDGAIELMKKNIKNDDRELISILEEIKEEYDYTIRKLAE